MYTKTLYKHIHFTKKGNLIYQRSENIILCSEDIARELIPKHFLSNFPYKDEWFELLIKILEEEHYAYFYKIYLNIGDTKIETGLMQIDIKQNLIEEVPDNIQEEIFKKLINTLKEDRYASSSY